MLCLRHVSSAYLLASLVYHHEQRAGSSTHLAAAATGALCKCCSAALPRPAFGLFTLLSQAEGQLAVQVIAVEYPGWWMAAARWSRAVSKFETVPCPNVDEMGYVQGLIDVVTK